MTKTPKVKTAAYIQFSKRLATAVTVFWCVFRLACLGLLIYSPSVIDGLRNVIQGADDVMMANIAFYCGNSVAEKGITGYFTRTETKQETESNG